MKMKEIGPKGMGRGEACTALVIPWICQCEFHLTLFSPKVHEMLSMLSFLILKRVAN